MATVVGEPTGNAPSAGGELVMFEMPRARLRLSTSIVKWTRPAPERDPADTITTDFHVPTTIRDVREGRDPQVEWLRGRSR